MKWILKGYKSNSEIIVVVYIHVYNVVAYRHAVYVAVTLLLSRVGLQQSYTCSNNSSDLYIHVIITLYIIM